MTCSDEHEVNSRVLPLEWQVSGTLNALTRPETQSYIEPYEGFRPDLSAMLLRLCPQPGQTLDPDHMPFMSAAWPQYFQVLKLRLLELTAPRKLALAEACRGCICLVASV